MIIEQLNKIIFEIRLLERRYDMPPHVNFDGDLKASAIIDKQQTEERIAYELYQAVRKYALEGMAQ